MLVKATYFLGQKEPTKEIMESSANYLSDIIKENSEVMTLTTDEDELIGKATRAYFEEDHVAVEYDCDEKYKELLIKEGFTILD